MKFQVRCVLSHGGDANSGPSTRSTGTVTATDGGTVGYVRLGAGPALVVLHGAMESAGSHLELAEALADAFTVYLPDRRGRGLSAGPADSFSIETGVGDVQALLEKTGAHDIFGVSSGGIIALQAALSLGGICRAAIFEPPLIINGSLPLDWFPRYEREIASGDVTGALITAMKGARMGPPALQALPYWLLRPFTKLMTTLEGRHAGDASLTMKGLAPTLRYDLQMAVEMSERLDDLKGIQKPVLLLGGSKSAAYLRSSVDALEVLLPNARRVEFEGLDHGASGNANRHGQPARVAEELRRFFGCQ